MVDDKYVPHPLYAVIQEGIPLSLLADLAEADGPDSHEIYRTESATSYRRQMPPHSLTATVMSMLTGSSASLPGTDLVAPAPSAGRALRSLLALVAVVSLVTMVLAAEVLTRQSAGAMLFVAAGSAGLLLPVLWWSTFLVVRSRRRTVAAYSASQQRLSAFIGTATEVLWETTTDGVITYVGPRSEQVLGFRPEELAGQGMDIVLAGRDHQRACDLLATSLAGGHGWTGERFTMLSADGTEREMYSSALIHIGADGRPVGFTGTLRDVEPPSLADEQYLKTHSTVNQVLQSRSLTSVFQPIVALSSGAVIGAEALSRFPSAPHLAPDVLFQRAGDVGLGVELELLAAQTALRSAVELPDGIYLSVNLSPMALADERLLHVLTTSSWPCSQLVVEITEHASVTDYADLARAVQALRNLGIRIAVDDAGAGYASFRHILQLRPDYIKLDRGLVDGLDRDPAKRALAGAFVAFGREVDAAIIAEGVETGLEVQAARALGIEAAQGFHLAKPTAANASWGTVIGR